MTTKGIKADIIYIIPILALLAFGLMCCGCNSSPAQVHGNFSLLNFDNRRYYELPIDSTNWVWKASKSPSGHGSNSRVYAETFQVQVLYKSPMTASSNNTSGTLEIPMVK
jgi:hypothetical protein